MSDKIILACNHEHAYSVHGDHPAVSDIEAVKQFRREGNLFGIITERDVFGALANMGEYDEEYDFIVCSAGASTVVRLPIEAGGYGAPTRMFTDTANNYFLYELYDLFTSVGASYMTADVFGCRGGDDEGQRIGQRFDGTLGLGCWMHYWGGGGKYHSYLVNRDSLSTGTAFSQSSAVFKNKITAEGVAAEVCRRYTGRLRAFASGCSVIVTPAQSNNVIGIKRFADLAGIPHENIWVYGCDPQDLCLMRSFNGIAKVNAHPSILAATPRRASSVQDIFKLRIQ